MPDKSTQTQLLAHYTCFYGTLVQGKKINIIFLDFARAFDIANYRIVLEKVAKQNIKVKLGRWIKEFITNRKLTVVAN